MGRKVVATTILVSFLWLAIGLATSFYFHGLYESHARDLTDRLATIQAIDTLQDVLWKLQATVLEVVERADSHTRTEVAVLEDLFERHLAEAASEAGTPEAQALIADIRERFAKYRDCCHRRLNADDISGSSRAAPMETARAAHAVAESCKRLLQVHQRLLADLTARRSGLRVSFDLSMLALWVTGPTLGIIWGLWVARGLSRSISQISISLTDAAGGLEHEVGRVELHPSDDLPALQHQVQEVSSRIRQVVDQLQQARRETLQADRLAAAGELAAGVAHELRNPLTAVKLLIQTAAERPGEQRLSAQQLHVILEQVIRMENTIQGLLDFARPPAMHRVRHDLRETLRRALNLVGGRARQQRVSVREDFSSVPVVVEGDPEQLHQVFVNLLLNGIEALPQGGQLEVSIRGPERADGGCRVSVRDSGTGIPAAIMERLFEPFVTGKEGGTGLGLPVSQRIVKQHGGRLIAANRDDAGAEFVVELPVAHSPSGGAGDGMDAASSPGPRV